MRCDSDPWAASCAAVFSFASGASIRPASSHPPSSPQAISPIIAQVANGVKARIRSERLGTNMPSALMF
jgi:hypothetical protein